MTPPCSSLKFRSFMDSKHFFTNGCTFFGILPSDRISSSSSFDRKKKRGKVIFFVSRNALSPFSTTSSCSLADWRSPSRLWNPATVMMCVWALTFCMMSRQMRSISRNAAPSLGICFIISSDPKMGSR